MMTQRILGALERQTQRPAEQLHVEEEEEKEGQANGYDLLLLLDTGSSSNNIKTNYARIGNKLESQSFMANISINSADK